MALQQTTDKLFYWYNSSFKIMNFGDLRDYIRDYKKMKMKHIYQPVMIKALLEAGGRCSGRQIAQKFLELDESQIDYYKKITSVMPGRVLKEKGIVSRDSDGYSLKISDLTNNEKSDLVSLCDKRLSEYIVRRGGERAVWLYRTKGPSYVPGPIRFEVLKNNTCEVAFTYKIISETLSNKNKL